MPFKHMQNVWMKRLALKLDPKVVFLSQKTLFEKIFPTMITRYLNLHVQPLFNVTPIIITTFDLWMNKG
jgi:hypothetical protein